MTELIPDRVHIKSILTLHISNTAAVAAASTSQNAIWQLQEERERETSALVNYATLSTGIERVKNRPEIHLLANRNIQYQYVNTM